MKRLALLHTAPVVVSMFDGFMKERFPDLDCFHMLDQSLIQDLLRGGGMKPGIVRRIAGHVSAAMDAEADFVLFTCSSTSPAVDVVRQMVDVPIMKIDDPMAAKAVTLGPKIGLMCTAASTAAPSESLIREHAAKAGRAVEVEAVIEGEAFKAVIGGDRAKHDSIVKAAVVELAKRSDVIVLAQASMAHLQPELASTLSVPVLASPELCLAALAEIAKQ